MAATNNTIENRQKFIDDPEARKAKIQTLLRDLTPEEVEEMKAYGEFDPSEYHGDDASDFFWDLPDGFIYRHIDDLIACGAKVEDINQMIGGDVLHDTAAFLRNFNSIADRVGHGINFDAFARTYGVDPERSGDEIFVDLFQAAYEDFFDQWAFYSSLPHPSHFANGVETGRRFTKLLLANGASAKQLIAKSYAGYPETLWSLSDLFLENDADANDIVSRFDNIVWEERELAFFLENLEDLLAHGLDISRVQNLSRRISLLRFSEADKTKVASTLAAHDIKF